MQLCFPQGEEQSRNFHATWLVGCEILTYCKIATSSTVSRFSHIAKKNSNTYSSTVICKNLVSAKVNKIELDIRLEGSDYAASNGAIRISVPCFKTDIQQQKPSISGKYQAEVRPSLMHKFLLIMGLFEVLIANMIFICGANNIKINIT